MGPVRDQGPGESLRTSGDGSGVRSLSALSAGDDKADPGDKDMMLAADIAFLREPPCAGTGTGVEWDGCSCAWPSMLERWSTGRKAAGGVSKERSVWRTRPAAVGVRTWARKG
jgi:hypothetical protein